MNTNVFVYEWECEVVSDGISEDVSEAFKCAEWLTFWKEPSQPQCLLPQSHPRLLFKDYQRQVLAVNLVQTVLVTACC